MGRRALVTGAASGLAAGIATMLARNGFERVAITYRNTPADNTVAAIVAAGSSATAQHIDFLDDAATIEDALQHVAEEAGPFDTLVHGVGPMTIKRFERSSLDDYTEMFDGNVRSAVLAARAVLAPMRAACFGRLIFFGMNGSSETRPYRGFSLHQAAKSGVVAFARGLALEEAKYGITVNVIEPGDIRDKNLTRDEAMRITAGVPRGRKGSYEDVGDAVNFLVAPERDYITGAVLAVTGGLMDAGERTVKPS